MVASVGQERRDYRFIMSELIIVSASKIHCIFTNDNTT